MHEKEAAIGYCGCCNYAAKLTGQRLVGIPDENGTTFKPSQPIRMALPNSLIRAKNRSEYSNRNKWTTSEVSRIFQPKFPEALE